MSSGQTPQEELTLGAVGLRVGNGIWANSVSCTCLCSFLKWSLGHTAEVGALRML